MRGRLVVSLCVLGVVASGLTGAGAVPVDCAPTAGVQGGEWPMAAGDLTGSRNQAAEHVLDARGAATLAPDWTFDANFWSVDASGRRARNSEITGYPVVVDGCVFVGTSTGSQQPGWVFAINADTGEAVWRRQMSHGVYSTLAVEAGRVFVFVSRVGGTPRGLAGGPIPWGPYVAALDQHTGALLWQTTVDWQVGSDAVASPIVFDGMVIVGISGTAAEGDEGERLGFQGNFAILDSATGAILKRTFVVPPSQWDDGYAGGAIWSTVSIDEQTKHGYVGTGNPFNYDAEHARTNAILKIDLDRTRATFGEIVDSYKGDVEQYSPPAQDALEPYCEDSEELSVFAAGFECGNLDLDFGAQPNIFTDETGRTLVGAGQKSGVYHAVDAETMEGVWTATLGVPSLVGGIVGTPAVDPEGIYGPHTLAGYLWSVTRDEGDLRWVSPVADAVHWGNPVTVANHVVYTVDLKGFLDAYDSQTGVPLLHRPIGLGAQTGADPTLTWGGVTVARGAVFASVGVGLTSVGAEPWPSMPNGYVVAFAPQMPGLG